MDKLLTHPMGGGRLSIRLALASVVIGSFSLTGCDKALKDSSTIVQSQDQAASVLMTPTAVIQWSDISSALAPNFQMSGQAALPQALPITERINEQVLHAVAANLGVGLSQVSTSGTRTTNATSTQAVSEGMLTTDSGSVTKTSNETVTKSPGVAPNVVNLIPASFTLPTNVGGSGALELDAALKYKAANFLNQSVQITNRETESAAQRSCYIPYLVRFKLAVMPYRSKLAYAVHTRAAFFNADSPSTSSNQDLSGYSEECGSNTQALPVVVPMLVADDIQIAAKARAAESAQQIGLALSALVGGAGVNIGGNNLNQTIRAIQNQEVSSSLTVTRQADNTLYIRISPNNESSGAPSLIGQTYDIAVLLLVPRGYFPAGKISTETARAMVALNTYTEFRNVFDGSVLPSRPAKNTVKQLENALTPFLQINPDSKKVWSALTEQQKLYVAQSLSVPIQEADFPAFDAALAKPLPDSELSFEWIAKGRYERILWTALSGLSADSPFKTAILELPSPSAISIDPNQTAIMIDDGKEYATITLQRVQGTVLGSVSSHVELALGNKSSGSVGSVPLAANQISYDGAADLLTLRFPSPTHLGMDNRLISKTNSKLVLLQSRCDYKLSLCPELLRSQKGRLEFPLQIQVADGEVATKGVATK